MTHEAITNLLEEAARLMGHSFNRYALQNDINLPPQFEAHDLEGILSYLGNMSYKARMTMVNKAMNVEELVAAVTQLEQPLLVFLKGAYGSHPQPWWISTEVTHRSSGRIMARPALEPDRGWTAIQPIDLFTWPAELPPYIAGRIPIVYFYPITDFTSEHHGNPGSMGSHDGVASGGHGGGHHDHHDHHHLSPLKRLFMLLRPERKDVGYIYVFAIAVALINLTLPLGTQAIMGLISGGMVFNSVIILISMVVVGVVLAGGMQIMQLSVVEMLQRRIFARAAFEFAYRVPRISMPALQNLYAPEQMNRFFEVMNVQKAIPKLLIDLTAAILQVVSGLALLAFYHPFFVFFGLFLIGILGLFLAYYAPRGVKTGINESRYKYKVVAWFQDMARALIPFKMTGNSALAVGKTDEYVDHYLFYRKKHFNILITQYSGILIFKSIVIAGLLIIGTVLVVDRQITLGQFVASEIVIITVVSAVEKIIMSLEVVYDALVAVDKLGHVTDLQLERGQGIELPIHDTEVVLEVKDLSFSYDHHKHALHHFNLKLPQGQHVAISGGTGSGKHTFVKVLLGLYPEYHGSIVMNKVSLRDASLASWRSHIGENVINSELFEGSIYDNIAMGRPGIAAYHVSAILQDLGMDYIVNQLPQGLYTQLSVGTPLLHNSALYAITLARTLITKPRLVILDDEIQKLGRSEKLRILSFLQQPSHNWSVIYLTNDPVVLASSSQVIHLQDGRQVGPHA